MIIAYDGSSDSCHSSKLGSSYDPHWSSNTQSQDCSNYGKPCASVSTRNSITGTFNISYSTMISYISLSTNISSVN